ncbi:hypothetical protein, conserved [Leishmania lindenbergi]|uniref:Transmembrane protein n=1 Tax=Leishmania lindenbergi TaxID=651832 RepID=A0AAW3A9K2_9TRYP
MTHHSHSARTASVAVALTMIVMAALCCTSAECISATPHTRFESERLLVRILESSEAVTQIRSAPPGTAEGTGSLLRVMANALPEHSSPNPERRPDETSQVRFTLAFAAGRVHEAANQARAVSPGVVAMGAVATTPAGKSPTLQSSLSVQLSHRPLANGEEVHSVEQLNKASPLSPSHQRKQLVPSSYKAAGQLSAQQGSLKGTATEAVLVPRTVSINSSEGVLSSEGDYGAVLSSGVIASFTVALVFAGLLLILVLVEVCAMVIASVKHRRMRATREAKDADGPAELKCGDFRDTAGCVPV